MMHANIHIEGWYKSWLPKASTRELQRLLGTDYGRDPAVARRLEAELASRDQPRPAPMLGKPKPIPHGVKATPGAIEAAARKRGEPAPEPTGLAKQIVDAGRRRRGEIQ